MSTRLRLSSQLMCVALLSACGAGEPVTPDVDVMAVRPGGGGTGGSSVSYSVVEIALPAGYTGGNAADVNDAGLAVGTVDNGGSPYVQRGWFKAANRSAVTLLPWYGGTVPAIQNSAALAVSSANADGNSFIAGYVIGPDGNSAAARWLLRADGTVDNPVLLSTIPSGLNDAGTVAGGLLIQRTTGDAVTITPPSTPGELTDINATEDLLYSQEGPSGRSWVRTGAGTWVRLDPPPGMSTFFAYGTALSNETTLNGVVVVFVAGKVQTGETECYPMRWTVDVQNGKVIATERRTESGTGLGVNSSGDVSGTYGSRTSVKPFVWLRASGAFTTLPMPKGITDGKGVAISHDGTYIAGYGRKSLTTRALLWTRK